MLKQSKKILSTIMVVVMVLAGVPLSGFVGLELPALDWGIKASAKTVASSGQCGDNIYWTYDSSTKELIISGEGPMTDYGSYSGSPFYDSNIKSVVIGDGVTTIGNYAFRECTNLTSITIPDSVTTIGNYAFQYCTNLASVTIPNSVTTIGNYIFSGCSSLETLTIGSGSKEIPVNAFRDLTALKTVNLSEGVEKIGNSAFCFCTNLTSITIPDSVTTIGYDIFYGCTSLETLTIGSGLKEIPAYAFSGCTNLTSVTIPDGVKTIGDYAFSGCTYLETINIPDSVTFVGVEILKNTAWFNYRGKGLIVLDGWAYGYKGSDENVTITFDETVKNVADEAFKNRSNVVAFEVDADNPYLLSENGVLFTKDKTELIAAIANNIGSEYMIPDTVEIIHSDAFYNCNSLWKITIPASVKSIGTEAFYISSSRSRSVYITDLEAWCKIDFANWSANPLCYYSKLYINGVAQSNITIPATITEIKPYAFYYCDSIKTLTIPDSVTTIGNYAFNNCDALTSVTLGDSVTTIGNYAFGYCYNLTTVTIPDSVTTIGDYAFRYCINLTSVTIGDSVTTIGDYAFRDCNNLTSVTLGDSVTTIGYEAFRYCYNLISITLSKDLQTIGYGAFGDCPNLRDVFYPGSQEDWDKVSIGDYNDNLTNADLFLLHRHNYTVTVTKHPTCTVAGEALYTCVHGDTKTEVIQPLGHTWDEGKITANSTCNYGGTKTYTCTVCFGTKSETIATLDHDYQLISSTDPTCTKNGYEVYRCTQCPATKTVETEAMLGHDWQTWFTVDIDSTCTTTGVKSKHCNRCADTKDETIVPLKDHAWQDDATVTKIPTCTAVGESVVLCRDCKIVKDGSNVVIPALGHDAASQPFTVDVPATCIETGKQSKHCTRCNYIEQVTMIPKSDHDYYVAAESTATCYEGGKAIYVCRMCKDSFAVENSPALGHDFEYIIVVSPTCKAEGYEIGECTRCDATDTRPVAKIDHDYVRTEVSPTCLDDGVATYTCAYGCGTTYDEVLPALGHSYPASWVVILPATCSDRGTSIKICRACSEVMSQVMPKLPHADANNDGVCDTCDATDAPVVPDKPDTPDVSDPSADCDCNCHKSGLFNMLFKLILFFQKFLRLNKTCECGVAHY